jgi:tRNA(Ile)-lysidine synthase
MSAPQKRTGAGDLGADAVEAAVRAGGLLAEGEPVVVLYSGGRDSSCLLDLAVRIAGRPAVCALHINYRLRKASDAEQAHCAATCAARGVELAVRRAPPRPRSGNLQAWARELRFAAARELAEQRGASIATGHTASDQVETILYRLASSPSRRALLGMPERQGRVVRPLLGFTREQVTAYCLERGLAWVDDDSNATDAYARNRVRHGLAEALCAVHPGAQANVLALARTLREEAEALDALVDGELAGRRQIALARLRELPTGLARLIVQRLADQAAGGAAPGAARRTEEILALTQGALDLPHGVRAIVRGGMLSFTATPPFPGRRGAEPVRGRATGARSAPHKMSQP